MPRSYRRQLEPAERVRELRRLLSLTQAEFAKRLGVHVRTVIRGEQRGIEIPWATWKSRGAVRAAWDKLEAEAKRRRRSPRGKSVSGSSAIAEVSRKPKRLRLSRDLIRDRRRRPARATKGAKK